ncbi:MAG: hypothetical protein QXV17_14785 [Candidatus Micrarchaeaceae archaeon]
MKGILSARRVTILLTKELSDFFDQHPEIKISEFGRISMMEKIQRMGLKDGGNQAPKVEKEEKA